MADFASALWNKPAAADSTPADPVTRSLRFDTASTQKLTRTFGTPTSQKKVTISWWMKLSEQGNGSASYGGIITVGDDSSNYAAIKVMGGATNTITVDEVSGGAYKSDRQTSRAFRDMGAWMHCVHVIDTTDSTADDRSKLYINGTRYTGPFATSYATYDQDYDTNWSKSGEVISIGFDNSGGSPYFGGYLADIHYIDGQALDASDFAETNSSTGQWVPKEYSGTYGNNGFHIDAQPAHDAELLVSSIDRNDGDTDFADVAAGHTITTGGDPEHSIAVGNPFTGDGRAIYFDGTDDYLTVDDGANIDLGTGDFTIEFWMNSDEDTQNAYVTGRWNATPNGGAWDSREWGLTCTSYGGGELDIYVPYTGGYNASSLNVCDSKWHHIAIVRHSGDAKLYVDGKYQIDASVLDSYNMSFSSKLLIGGGQSLYWRGAIYDYRISDTARYTSGTSDFDVPTEKFTSDSDTLLLIQPDKDDTTFHDESSSPATVTTVSSPTRTASTPYDAAAKSTAISFDGTGDYLSVATSSDFDFGSGSYTYEGWFYFNGFSETPEGIFSRNNSSTQEWAVCTNSSGTLQFFESVNNSYNTSSFTFSTGQWYHIALCKNGTTYKVYVDADEKISATLSSAPDANLPVIIGRFYDNYDGYYLDGYCYDFRAQKGVDTGGSKPSAPLELNPVYIGGDQSGNKNHFTPTNISSHDVMLDVPTKNYATWNPLDLQETASTAPTFAEGNLSLSTNSSGYGRIHSTFSIPSTGKWYAEFYSTSFNAIGVRRKVGGGWPSGSSDLASVVSSGSITNASGASQSGLASWSSGDILGVEVNCDDNTIQFLKNGSNYGTSESFTHYAGETFFTYTDGSSGTAYNAIANFGADPTFAGNYAGTPESSEWAYSPSTDFKSLNSSNLDAPSVTPSENFNTVLYTGTRDNSNSLGATSNAVTGMGFEPSLLWIKDRDNQSSNYGSSYSGHYLFDSVQGAGKAINIDGGMYTGSNDFVSNLDGYNGVSSFDSDGFTLDEAEAVNYAVDSDYNGSIDTYERYAAWGWKLGSNGSSSTWAAGNTDPTTEKYNASAGVSVIRQEESSGSYPMTGVTVNHSLGEAPEFAFLMDNSSNTQEVFAWHKDLDANKYLKLTQNSAQTTGSGYFPSGCSTATTFQIGSDIAGASGYDGWWDIYLYLFSGVEGYSKFGKYTGNASADGPFIYTGFRPAFVLWKRATGSSNSWNIMDNKREGYNPQNDLLFPDSSTIESNVTDQDLLSNGFKLRTSGAGRNANNETFIYAAWAEVPFSKGNAR